MPVRDCLDLSIKENCEALVKKSIDLMLDGSAPTGKKPGIAYIHREDGCSAWVTLT